MAFDPDIFNRFVDLWRPSVVLHVAKMAVTSFGIAMSLQEKSFRQFQDDGEEYQESGHYLFMNILSEFRYLGPILLDHGWMWTLVLRDEFGNVVYFRVVEVAFPELSSSI